MKSAQRILVILHPSLVHTPAIERGTALAKALDGELWLGLFDAGPRVAWMTPFDRKQGHELESRLRDESTARLGKLRDELHARHGFAVHLIDDRHRPQADRIAETIERHDIDLVLKDAGHETALRRLVFVPLDWDLLRVCPIPLWLTARLDSPLPRRIAIGVDPLNPEHGAGALNEAILSTTQRIATASDAALRVYSAFAGLPYAAYAFDPQGLGAGFEMGEVYEELRVQHREAFHALLDAHGMARGEGEILAGSPTVALTAAIASYAPDLLVVGTLHRRGLDRLFMGSTAEHLVGHAPCDILAVPAFAAAPVRSRRQPILDRTPA